MSHETIIVETSGKVGIIRLNRPQALNALNAKVIQSAVANDRLVMTLEIDGKVEVRTFDVKTLTPTGRLDFSATP